MNAQHFARAHPILMSIAFALLCMTLLGCKPKPQSMFEQQAEVESAQEIGTTIDETSHAVAVVEDAHSVISENLTALDIDIIKQQAIARQPDCDTESCQYFELNIVDFSPKQPWLTSIMWQTIAHVLAPEMPLPSQDEAAKKIVLMLLNQIEYGEGTVSTLPMYQRIDTEVVFNPVSNAPTTIQSTPTGYLAIRSSVSKDDSQEQFNYVMLDMQKKLQLNIKDILLSEATPDELLATFQTAKKDWLTLQGVQAQYLDDWPLQLSEQWYLDKKGLHMVYQSSELLEGSTGAVDLLVPYALLQGLIKPNYRVYSNQTS
ncbi:DUF3298 domain-containing protein [Psychrobacter sp. DM8]|uniref:DUF3298 domain-containing protein n=1 Tax=Psychrobacter sp. DM8 TaxID=3440636 RepID=UPI003F5070B6